MGAVLAGDVALVAEIERRAVGDRGVGREAHHRAVALRGDAVGRERRQRCAAQRRRHRPRRVGVLVAPAQPELQRQLLAPAEIDRAAELRADHRAQRVGGLPRDREVQRLRAGLGKTVLRAGVALQAGERRDVGVGRGCRYRSDSRPRPGRRTGWPRCGPARCAAAGRGWRSAATSGCSCRRSPHGVGVDLALAVVAVEAGQEGVGDAVAAEARRPLRAGGVARRHADAQAGRHQAIEAGREAADIVGDGAGAGIGADRAQAAQRAAPGAPQRPAWSHRRRRRTPRPGRRDC